MYEQQNENEMLYFKMSLLQAEIKMQGMIAENKVREMNNHDLTYKEDDFERLIEEYGIHHNAFPMLK
jgi:hypothetical protein